MKIEAHQGIFLTILLCFGSLGAISAVGSGLGHNVWLLMLPAGLFGLALYFLYAALLRRCAGRDLLELNMLAFGPRGGKIALGFYMVYILFVISYYLLAIIDLWKLMDMRHTPLLVYIVLVLLLLTLSARRGLTALSRAAGFFVLFYFLMAVVDTLLLWPELSWLRLLPISLRDWPRFWEDAAYVSALLFTLMPLALLYLPHLNETGRGPKCLGWGMGLAFADLLLANLRNVALFGDALQFKDYPTYQALRLAEWGSGILRLELFGMLAALSVVFLGGALAFWGLGQLWHAVSGISARRGLMLLVPASGLLMLWMEDKINFIDNTVLLILLGLGALVSTIMLFSTILILQKSNCQNK